jgi:Zn finger protein HypA/HybF involved in hydrogenase expression
VRKALEVYGSRPLTGGRGQSATRGRIERELEGESMNSKCEQCGQVLDLLTAFTLYKVCGKCTRANHKRVRAGK